MMQRGANVRFVLPAAHAGIGCENYGRTVSLVELAVLMDEDQPMTAINIELRPRCLAACNEQLAPRVEAAGRIYARRGGARRYLSRQSGQAIAESRHRLGAPFMFCTGYGGGVMIPEHFRNVPVVPNATGAASIAALDALARVAAP